MNGCVFLDRENLSYLNVKIFADVGDLASMVELSKNPLFKGFAASLTLMRQAGVTDYEKFARSAIEAIPDLPISFEVCSDDFTEMEAQAKKISSWGDNVYVKIPITNTRGRSSVSLIKGLASDGIKQNVTAITRISQVDDAAASTESGVPMFISISAGRMADTGCDPVPIIQSAARHIHGYWDIDLIWASPREPLNIIHANRSGCDIITVGQDIIKKLHLFGKDLGEYSLETVKMFHDDAVKAGYKI